MRYFPTAARMVVCALILHALPAVAFAQIQPPPDILRKIIAQLPKTSPSHFKFDDAHQPIDPVCKMQTFNVTLWRDTGGQHTFSMLSDPATSDPVHTNILAVTSRFEVDADGSPRAYNPEDPNGQATCSLVRDGQGHYVLSGAGRCALDNFHDGGIYVFRDAIRLRDSDLGDDWIRFWSLIRDRNLKSFDLSALLSLPTVDHYYLFYWQAQKMTAIFNDGNVQRDSLGYPCVRGPKSRFPGYFVSATTLQHAQDQPGSEASDSSDIAPPECAPLHNIDSELVPYFIIPRGTVGGASIGDLVIARIRNGTGNPLVYGIAADAGPIAKIGEGSIAFNQQLRGKAASVMNNKGLNKLAIDDGTAVGVLILGGTNKLLNGDYTRENIERIGRAQFARWGGAGLEPTIRLNACFGQAKVN